MYVLVSREGHASHSTGLSTTEVTGKLDTKFGTPWPIDINVGDVHLAFTPEEAKAIRKEFKRQLKQYEDEQAQQK